MQPSTDLTVVPDTPPHLMAPKIVDDDDVMAKQEKIGTHFMSLLIMFDVYTSKKVWMKCGR